MSEVAAITAESPAPAGPSELGAQFLAALVMQARAHDSLGTLARLPDEAVLNSFVLGRERRRRLPIIGEPDPATLLRLEMFYAAVALTIESRCGVLPSPMQKISNEGFGRAVLLAGRLVVLSRHLRDVHRFGFDSVERLAAEGEKLVEQGLVVIGRFPDVAQAD